MRSILLLTVAISAMSGSVFAAENTSAIDFTSTSGVAASSQNDATYSGAANMSDGSHNLTDQLCANVRTQRDVYCDVVNRDHPH
jgi:hypothetical protein